MRRAADGSKGRMRIAFAIPNIRVSRPAMQGSVRGPLILACLVALLAVALQAGAAPAPAIAGCKHHDDRPAQLSAKHARSAVICLINKKRRHNGRGGLNRSNRLNDAAARHSVYMRKHSCFSHQCSGESSIYTRLKKVGYLDGGLSRWAYGENIAWGVRSRGTPQHVVNAWMNSSEHRANILSGTFRDVGVGYSHKGGRAYYTADFGLRIG
jgi:uncharacterized protein YkwD